MIWMPGARRHPAQPIVVVAHAAAPGPTGGAVLGAGTTGWGICRRGGGGGAFGGDRRTRGDGAAGGDRRPSLLK